MSRTSKTPTSIYLANRGIKTANIPLVHDAPVPAALVDPKAAGRRPRREPGRIVQVRQHRVLAMKSDELTDSYVDRELVTEEVTWSRKLCARQGWPIIDVTRRSIEETAAAIDGADGGAEAGVTLVLASASRTRRSLFENAGVEFE